MEAKKELTFTAKMISDCSDDSTRVFAINYDIDTKEISIIEGKSKATERDTKFLTKQVAIDPKTQNAYTQSAFFIGAKITVAGRLFELVDAPEYTLSYMEAFPSKFRYTEIDSCLECVNKIIDEFRNLLEKMDPRDSGLIAEEKAKDAMLKLAPALPKQATFTLIRRFSKNGSFNYKQVIEGAEN